MNTFKFCTSSCWSMLEFLKMIMMLKNMPLQVDAYFFNYLTGIQALKLDKAVELLHFVGFKSL